MSQNSKNKLYKSSVIKGKGIAKTLGYPTINLSNPEILSGEKEGVYLCRLNIKNNKYFGLLYYGPRIVLNENHTILEIYVIDFEVSVYGEEVSFQLVKFIRKTMKLSSLEKLKVQITKDFTLAQKLIKYE